jgi:uncharacterized protein
MTSFDVRNVRLRSGERHRDVREVELGSFELGGQRYIPVPEKPEAELAITRASSGLVFELDFDTNVLGPCMRCLEDAGLPVHIRAREYQDTNPGDADELSTPYLVDDRLDLTAWARDAVALELPDRILCTPECAGLCAVCGKNLNAEPHEHGEPETDERWAKLAELREQL